VSQRSPAIAGSGFARILSRAASATAPLEGHSGTGSTVPTHRADAVLAVRTGTAGSNPAHLAGGGRSVAAEHAAWSFRRTAAPTPSRQAE
jgi:hypothetical protein